MFKNPEIGDKGLVHDIREPTSAVNSFRTTVRTFNWFVGIGGLSALGALLKTLV